MAKIKSFNLFVYGTLMNPSVFRAVLGRRLVSKASEADGAEAFFPRRAILNGYKKVSPDRTYLYAVPDPHGRIRGHLVGPLPGECLSALRYYEGRNYSRKRIRVTTREGTAEAVAFVGNLKQLEHAFGYAFHDPLKQEILLQKKIDAALNEAQREKLHTDGTIGRRAVGELRGSTIRDLYRRHFEAGGISDYAIRHSIMDDPLRDFDLIADDPEAIALAPNYLELVIRQVIFNQFEERIRTDFRYELDHIPQDENYYERTISSLAALELLNASGDLLDAIVRNCMDKLQFGKDHLVDFIRWSVMAADSIYDPQNARRQTQFIRNHMGRGYISLGAELEFSNIGHEVIRDPKGDDIRDPLFDGFLYFRDFGLDILTWKLGGHLDDHREKASGKRRRGFFEVALGNLSIEANLSKPITADPWILNQFIHAARRFYKIAPHSVHVSLQLRSQNRPLRDRTLPLGIMKCLFAIAGDPRLDENGALKIGRLTGNEIVNRDDPPSMLFSDIRKRYSSETDEAAPLPGSPFRRGRFVQQFRFLRLSPRLNYESVVLALKGLQLSLRPGSFLTPQQYKTSRRHRKLFHDLLEWGLSPQALSEEDMTAFLTAVRDGLMSEYRGKPTHSEAYIEWGLSRLLKYMQGYNALCAHAGGNTGE